MDERLFKLDLYLQDHTFNRDEIADLFSVTTRQLTRLLNKWQEEGILTYNSGVGRGNASEIIFNVDIEKEFITYLIRNINNYTMESLQAIIDYPMHDDTRKAIKVCIEESLYGKKESDLSDYHIDYIYRMPQRIHPLESMDISLSTILLNVGDRLYYNYNNEIHNLLVLYDEWVGNELFIHLRRNIRFSNGDILFATDVVDCLKNMIEKKRLFSDLNSVLGIEVLDHYKFKITFQKRMDIAKVILCQEYSTIYKVRDGQTYFTGAYEIESQDEDNIKLKINPYFHGPTPDISGILLINDNDKYRAYFNHNVMKEKETYQSYIFDFVLFNPMSKLTLENRKEAERIIKSFQKDEHVEFEPFIDSLKIMKLKGSKDSIDKMVDLFRRMSKTFEVIEMTLDEYIQNDISDLDVDAIFMNESVPSDYVYYDLLTNGKYSEWYRHLPESQNFMYIYNYKHKPYWTYIEKIYKQFVQENCFMIELNRYHKVFELPSHFENITTNMYGVINYRSIIMKNEVPLND